MDMKARLVLVLKGVCMGLADVVPGVSGGTMALILGIYERLVRAIRSIDQRLLKPFAKALKGGFRREARADFVAVIKEMDLPWLMTLAVGIGGAFVVGSRVIPTAMERYPEIMMAFFFGLVLASISAPMRMLERFRVPEGAALVVAAVAAFVLVGGGSFQPPLSHKKVVAADVESGGQTLKSMAEKGPSALTPEGIYWAPENEALRVAVPVELERGLNPKSHDNPYNDLVVPAGVEVQVPAPAAWFIFLAGFVAICAMVLPGISGSFILLIFGSYYFMLNALKGFIKSLIHLSFPATQFLYVSLFIVGAALGLALFTRLLTWLLERYPSLTMASLMGLMLGCLRAIWPFKERLADGGQANVLPSLAASGSTVWFAAGAFVVGLALVLGLTAFAKGKGAEEETKEG